MPGLPDQTKEREPFSLRARRGSRRVRDIPRRGRRPGRRSSLDGRAGARLPAARGRAGLAARLTHAGAAGFIRLGRCGRGSKRTRSAAANPRTKERVDGAARISVRDDLPRRHRPHGGRVHAGVAGPGAGAQGRPERAVRRARRHGLRPARLLWQPDRDAEPRPPRRGWVALQQHAHDGAVLAEPVVRDQRPQPSQQRDGVHHGVRDRLSGLQRAGPVRERLPVGDAARARLQHVHDRQVASDPVEPGDGGGPV